MFRLGSPRNARLPKGWIKHTVPKSEEYFTNGVDVQWEKPGDDEGWAKVIVNEGETYYVNPHSGETSWDPPCCWSQWSSPDENTSSCTNVSYCTWNGLSPFPCSSPDPLYIMNLYSEVYALRLMMCEVRALLLTAPEAP